MISSLERTDLQVDVEERWTKSLSESSLSLLSSSTAIYTRNFMYLKSKEISLKSALLKHARHWKSVLYVWSRLHSPDLPVEMIQMTFSRAPSSQGCHGPLG